LSPTPFTDDPSPLLLARGITKTFDRTRALQGADFELREREIHGLLGANGAGKSTLSKVISGHHVFDAGEMTYRGQAIKLRNTRDALRVGIAIVMQETSLVPDLTVLENIFLPQLGRPGRLDHPRHPPRTRRFACRGSGTSRYAMKCDAGEFRSPSQPKREAPRRGRRSPALDRHAGRVGGPAGSA